MIIQTQLKIVKVVSVLIKEELDEIILYCVGDSIHIVGDLCLRISWDLS